VVGSSLVFVFTAVNSLLVIINLIPSKVRRNAYGTDGYIIWKLIYQWILRKPYGYPDTSATFHPKESLLNIHGFVPKGFKVGIEILNDNSTTMEFVVGTLTKHLKIPQEEAVKMMLTIHSKGGILVPLKTYALAQDISSAINDEAKREGYKLVCRPVDAQQAHSADAKSDAADG
jgi:ATP-dependent Clp protease adaptor protein ClpS